MGFVKIFSDNIADAVGVTSAQVRKDFSLFGLSGNKKGGYVADELIGRLNEVLGKNEPQNIVVVGAGNLGTALMNYQGFRQEGMYIVAAFDTNPLKVKREAAIPVLPLEELGEVVRKHSIRVAIIAVPDVVAQKALDQLIEAGVCGVLNFAPIRLNAPENIVVNNMNVVLELENVIYFVNALTRQSRAEWSRESAPAEG